VAFKQRDAQHFFQMSHMAAQGRLGHIQPVSCAAQAAFFCNYRKIAQQPPVRDVKKIVSHTLKVSPKRQEAK